MCDNSDKHYTIESLLKDLHIAYGKRNGEPPRLEDVPASSRTYIRFFGSFSNALKAAGIGV